MKSTDKNLFACERQAHLYYENAAQVERDRIADRNARTRIEEQLRKERVQEAFYAKLWVTVNSIFLLIIIYAVIHFLRG